jgi:hypothetical protein
VRGRGRGGEQLESIWREFKNDVAGSALARFDKTIATLHRFESIRYPDNILRTGMQAHINFEKPTPRRRFDPSLQVPKDEVVVPDIDALVAVIFEKAHRNPLAFVISMPDEARAYLTRWNKLHIWEK